jgi:hypothetical protein
LAASVEIVSDSATEALADTRSRFASPDTVGVGLLLFAAVVLTWPIWREPRGVVNFIDYVLPVSHEATAEALRDSLSPWAGSRGLGGPNVGFLGTTEFLAAFGSISTAFGVEIASRLLLIVLVWLDALGAYTVLRVSYRISVGSACAGALFFILNPWVYDTISQGHLYTLELLAVAPLLILGVPRMDRITNRRLAGIGLAVAIAVGSDYHFGLLILGFLCLEMIYLVIRRHARRSIRLAVAVGAGVGLLSVYLIAFVANLSAIQGNNSPTVSDLEYFSRFTSWEAAFSLLRPGMNAWAQVHSHGTLFSLVWPLGCVAVSLLAVALILRGGWRRLTGSPTLPLVAFASVFLANGAQGVTEAAANWAYSNIPFAEIFRDPSKFLMFPLMMSIPVVGLLFDGEVPVLLRRRSASLAGASSGDDTQAVDSAAGRMREVVRRKYRRMSLVTSPVLVMAFFLPLLVPGIRTISTVPTNSDRVVGSPGSRVAYLPPWQFLRYPGQAVPVIDPVQVFPRGSAAGIGPDYDGSRGNRFLRWLYLNLYFRRTDSFYGLVKLVGVGDVVIRPELVAVTGNPVTEQMFSGSNLISALRTQRATYNSTIQDEHQIIRRVEGSSVTSMSSALLRIQGTNLDVLNDLADLTDLGAPAICFEPDCPAEDGGLTIGALGDVPPGTDASTSVQIGAVSSYGDTGESWIDGRVAYAEGFGAISSQLGDVAVGIGRSAGPLRFVGDPPTGSSDLWLQVLRGPEPARYSVRCAEAELTVSPPVTLSGYVWAWERIGSFRVLGSGKRCTISVKGGLGAVADGRLAEEAEEGSHVANSPPKILVGSATVAQSWERAKGSTFDYPGVPSTAAIVLDRGSLTFRLPAASSARHVYARVIGINGHPTLRARHLVSRQGPVIRRDERAWIDLGKAPASGGRAELVVSGGTVALVRVAVATPKDIRALIATRSSRIPMTLSGNEALDSGGDQIIQPLTPTDSPRYVIVRASTTDTWSLDGRGPDGTYAGYGQLYRVRNGVSTLTSGLGAKSALGAAVSVLFGVALLFGAVSPWMLRRRREKVVNAPELRE